MRKATKYAGHLPYLVSQPKVRFEPAALGDAHLLSSEFRSNSFLLTTQATAAVEFAIVAPVLFLMSFGMIVFGLYFVYDQVLLDVTAAATRASVAGITPAERDSLARQFISQYVANSSLLRSSDLTVTTNSNGSSSNRYSVTVNYSLQNTAIPSLASITSVNLTNITCTYTVLFGGY